MGAPSANADIRLRGPAHLGPPLRRKIAGSRPAMTSLEGIYEPTMDEAALLEVSRDAVIVVLKIGTPIMLISLIVGLIISLFQALTQIQEATLTFVPKILVVFVSLLLLAPFMLHVLTDFTEQLMQRIVG
jgi:flagellar biosynthetic protein FliQ